ncbi:hypothetical protein HX001_17065 [Empedobacter brevis]|uniref:Phage tail tape measure protein n=1 Tax=Empedobacter brevis TaxID=247 RepID=A0AAJ1QHJ3_9FLAO|nr:hypothetical protein [Empedobacter brevis]MDM1074198.1 hypothetical protein [Empedobacter brevis]
MSDLDPIELGIAINSEELMQEFQKMMASSEQLDKSLEDTKKKFNEFVQSQLTGNGTLRENAKLTEAQSNAIKRHAEALIWLKEQVSMTFDPTQLKVYEYQIQQAEKAIENIIDSANQRVELMDQAQLEAANKKLIEAGKLIDQISDKTFTPNFATPEELEVLSEHINSAENEMEQLGVVIDFVSNKLTDIDPASSEWSALADDINTANEMLGRAPAIYDATGNSIDQMKDALSEFQAQLSTETDPEKVRILNQNIENLESSIKAVKNAGRSGFDEFGNKIVEQKEATVQLQTELEKLIQDMAKLRLENEQGSEGYENLKQRAIEIRTSLASVNQEVNASASASANLDTLIRATTAITAGFSMAQGAAALFGNENENVQQTISKVTSTMAILQGLQQIQIELKRTDSVVTASQIALQRLYAIVVGNSTGALKAFRIALAATGIGAIILLLGALIANWDAVKKAIGLTTDEIEENIEIGKKANDLYAKKISLLQFLVKQNRETALSERQKKQAVKEYNRELGDTLGTVKDYAELESKIISRASDYVNYMQIKAQADAAYILSLEKQKLLLEQITALSTGDLDWFNRIDQSLQKFYVGGFNLLGGNKKVKYEISNEEILKYLNFPTKEQAQKAIKDAGYSQVIQSEFSSIYEKQQDGNKILNTSISLLKKSSEAADKLKIVTDKGVSAEIEADEKRLEILKARGKNTEALERSILNKKIAHYKNDKAEFEKWTQAKAVFEAGVQKKRDEKTEEQRKKEKAAQKKAEEEAKRLKDQQLGVLQDISDTERDIHKQTLDQNAREIEDIKDKYNKLREEVKKAQLGSQVLLRIDTIEKTETSNVTYMQGTDELLKQLEKEKEIYTAFEQLKTKIGAEEITKQYKNQMMGFLDFASRIQDEMDKILSKSSDQRSNVENARLKALEDFQAKTKKEDSDSDNQKYLAAYEATLVYQDKIKQIDADYLATKKELEKISDVEIRTAKLQELERLKKVRINTAKAEANESLDIWRGLSSDLTGISQKELDVRISSLDEYYKKASEYLDDDQKNFINAELEKAKNVKGRNDLETREKVALEKKKKLLAEIAKYHNKNNELVAEETEKLEEVNQELELIQIEKLQKVVEGFQTVSVIAGSLADAFAESNDELSQIMKTIAELADDVGKVVNAFMKSIWDGIVALVAALIKWIGKLFTMGKRARESRKKAIEEIKKWQAEMIAQQLEYNKTLRDRELIEARINDLYVSRVQNIREEMEALKKNKASVLEDMDRIWKRLLGSETIYDKTFKLKGGFLGFGKKTKVVDHYDSVANLLGIDQDTQITDELFEKLEKLNTMKPLTGDAKEAYEQLKKLRDEYGSIDDAMKQLEIDLKNAVTGTTAQSIADSIIEGIKSGKKSFADFADDIEGFLRNAILAGMSAKILEPEMQKLQDLLYEMMGDGVLSEEERKQWQQMYMKLAQDAQSYMDMMNQAGLNMTGTVNSANSLKGALEGMTAEQADLLAGQFGGLRLTQLETNSILKNGAAQQLAASSRMIEYLVAIENNTKRTANNTELSLSELAKIKDLLRKMADDGGRSGGIP